MAIKSNNKDINVVLLGLNAFSNFDTNNIAGAVRVRNLLGNLHRKGLIMLSNLIILDLLEIKHNKKKGNADGVEFLSIGYTSTYNLASIIDFLKKGKEFLRDNKKENCKNIIYNYEYPNFRNILLLLYAKKIGYKIVFDIVEDISHLKSHDFKNKLRNKISFKLLKTIDGFADMVFAISYHLYDLLNVICKGKVPVFLIPITVDMSHFKSAPEKKDKIEIFYGGSFAEKDGIGNLLSAFKQISKNYPDLNLVLTGKGQPSHMTEVFEEAKNNPQVIFKGFLQADEYYRLLNNADICCVTRNNSKFANAGFPFKLGEYLGAGKVIIVADTGDVTKYLVNNESAIIIKSNSEDEIKEAIIYCLQNLDTLKERLGQSAREIAKRNFDNETISEQIYNHLVNV